MTVSVVIRSKDEAKRLRLTLASLARQTVPAEVIVVNDGSSDDTVAVIEQAARELPLRAIHHALPRGRSAASNAGAAVAGGDVLLFLDGDTIAHPELVVRHQAAHAAPGIRVARGETLHLRCTRDLRDPESGDPWPHTRERLAALPTAERQRLCVTRVQITDDFSSIERRAVTGIYPGAGPHRLNALEMDALQNHPDCAVLWAAASGANQSVPRKQFLEFGGFAEEMEHNDHRELALRLCEHGARMCAVPGGRSYHLTHRHGWRNPLEDSGWETAFLRRHPLPAVKLLTVFWASLSSDLPIPPEARIGSLLELEAAARGRPGVDFDAVRRGIYEAHAGAGA